MNKYRVLDGIFWLNIRFNILSDGYYIVCRKIENFYHKKDYFDYHVIKI
jgi:hypothetical protein